MYLITLEWLENSQIRTRTISHNDSTLFPKTIRIGRGEANECDIVLRHQDPQIQNTVSKAHADIIYDEERKNFFLINLTRNRPSPKQHNPIIVNGRKIISEEVKLEKGTQIELGKITLKIKALQVPEVEAAYMVRCSGPGKHIVEKHQQGLNCPYCGYIVYTGTILKI